MKRINNFAIKPGLRDRYKIIAYQKHLTMRELLEQDILELLEKGELCYKAVGTPECSATLTVSIDQDIKKKMIEYKMNTGTTFRDIVMTAMVNRVKKETTGQDITITDLI